MWKLFIMQSKFKKIPSGIEKAALLKEGSPRDFLRFFGASSLESPSESVKIKALCTNTNSIQVPDRKINKSQFTKSPILFEE